MKTTTEPPPPPAVCPACGQPLKLYLARRSTSRRRWATLACPSCNYAQDERGKLTFWAGGIQLANPIPI